MHRIELDLADQDDTGPSFTCRDCDYMWHVFLMGDNDWWVGTLHDMQNHEVIEVEVLDG